MLGEHADGVPRRLSTVGGEVLIHGKLRPIVGSVTMDQIMVDVGDLDVGVGDEVVLIGEQLPPIEAGDARFIPGRVTTDDWASRLETIDYEIVCGIGPRVPRFYTRGRNRARH